jgi:pilus assembly protein Flp/PilA
MQKLIVALGNFKKDESGASLIEYSLLIGLITVAVVATVAVVSGWVVDAWTGLETTLTANPVP